MRTGLILAAALAVPAAAPAADPAVVYQTQPLGRVLDDTRAALRHVGGDPAVRGFNDLLRRRVGEKGFAGLDLNAPIVGYVVVPDDPAAAVAVVALPVTSEKAFLDLCERANKGAPKPLGGGLYELPPVMPELKARCRVLNGHAYIATAVHDPAPALDPKAIVPAAGLFDPAERGLVSARVRFDRIPPAARDKVSDWLTQMSAADPAGGGDVMSRITAELAKLGKRYVGLSAGAKELVVRGNLDPRTGDATAEAVLTAVPGSALDKLIAAQKPTTNKFAGLVTPDTVIGFHTRLPLFNDELKAAATLGLADLRKSIGGPSSTPAEKKLADAFFAGLERTVKTGEVDLAAVLRGPDKAGHFTAVAVLAFYDPATVAKAFRALVEDEPAEGTLKKGIAWDVAKADGVAIHTYAPDRTAGVFGVQSRAFGDPPVVAFAFAPTGIFAAIGPDAVATITAALAVKPAPAKVLDVVINPARLVKFAAAVGGPEAEAEITTAFGTADKLGSVLSLSVEGGAALTVRFAVSLRLFTDVLPRPDTAAPKQ